MRVTVLMFGWEFPPHISGGLGTACYGLTKSLVEEDVDLLFVVPKSHGDESIPLISAADVIIENQQTTEEETWTEKNIIRTSGDHKNQCTTHALRCKAK